LKTDLLNRRENDMPLHNLPGSFRVVLLSLCLGLTWPAAPVRAQSSVTYEYDALGRVTKATYSNGTVVTYSYDAADNRVSTTTTP
jgi:YD repeat-containing protein